MGPQRRQAFSISVRSTDSRSKAERLIALAEEARDAVQDAYINAFRHRDSFKGDSQISTWLHSIVVNSALMRLRLTGSMPTTSAAARRAAARKRATPVSVGGTIGRPSVQPLR